MYVYGPSSLANYPASVRERSAFPSPPRQCLSTERETATVNVPGHPWQSPVFLRELWRFIFKSKPLGSRVCWVYSCFGNWRLVVDCEFVRLCISVGEHEGGRYNFAQYVYKLCNSRVSHALSHQYELCGSLTVRYIDVRTWLNAGNVWSWLKSLTAVK